MEYNYNQTPHYNQQYSYPPPPIGGYDYQQSYYSGVQAHPPPPANNANQQNNFQYQSSPHEYQQYWSAYWSGYGDQSLMMQQWQKWYDQWNEYYKYQQQPQDDSGATGNGSNESMPPPPSTSAGYSNATNAPHANSGDSYNQNNQNNQGQSGGDFKNRMLAMAGYENEFTTDDPAVPGNDGKGYNNFVSGGMMHTRVGSNDNRGGQQKLVARLPGNTRGMTDADFEADYMQQQGQQHQDWGSQRGGGGNRQGGGGNRGSVWSDSRQNQDFSSQRGRGGPSNRGGRWSNRGGLPAMAPPPLPPGIPMHVPQEAKEFPISSGLLHSTKRIRGPNAGLKNPYEEESKGWERRRDWANKSSEGGMDAGMAGGGAAGPGEGAARGGGGGRGGERGGRGGGDRGGRGGGDRGGRGGGDRGRGDGRRGGRGGGGRGRGKDDDVYKGGARRLETMEIDLNKETEWTAGKELNSVEEILLKERSIGIDVEIEDVPIADRFDNARKHIKEGFMKKNYADSLSSLLHQHNVRLMLGTLTRPVRMGVYAGQFMCDVYIDGYHLGTAYDINGRQAKMLATEQAWNIILNNPGSEIVKHRRVDMEALPEMYPDAVVSGNIHKGKETNFQVIASKRKPGEFKPISSFIILAAKATENNHTMVLRQSADFCGMLLEFDFKRTPLPEPTEEAASITECKVYIEGQLYGTGSGNKRNVAKAVASKEVLDKLKKTNYTIYIKREFNEQVLDRAFLLEEEDQQKQQQSKKKQDQSISFTYGKGAALLQKMGWTGGGLGKEGNEGIMEPVSLKDIYGKEGLGLRSDIDVMKEFVPKMEKFLQRYVQENRMETLIITPKLNKSERTELYKISSRLGLKHQCKKCEKHSYILISHKLSCHDLLKYLVGIGGKNNMYELLDPEIKRKADREKLESEREKQALAAVKTMPRQQLLGFPVRQRVTGTDSKFPALKQETEEDEKEEEKKEEEKEMEEEEDEEGGVEDEKKQDSLSYFLNQFNIKVKEEKSLDERLKKIREKKQEEEERLKKQAQEKEEREKKLVQEREERLKRLAQEEEERAKKWEQQKAEREKRWAQQKEERERRLSQGHCSYQEFMETDDFELPPPPVQPRRKPAATPKKKIDLSKETPKQRKERLIAKNSLSFLLQQMQGGGNEQEPEEEEEEEEDEEEKEEEMQQEEQVAQSEEKVPEEKVPKETKEEMKKKEMIKDETQKEETKKEETKKEETKKEETKQEETKKEGIIKDETKKEETKKEETKKEETKKEETKKEETKKEEIKKETQQTPKPKVAKPAPVQKKPSLENETEEERKQRLSSKNSLSFFLQQMQSGSSDDDNKGDGTGGNTESLKEEDKKEKKPKQKTPEAKKPRSDGEPTVAAKSQKAKVSATQAKADTKNETEEQKKERLVKKNSLSFFLQQLQGEGKEDDGGSENTATKEGETESQEQEMNVEEKLGEKAKSSENVGADAAKGEKAKKVDQGEPSAKKQCTGSGVLESSSDDKSASPVVSSGKGKSAAGKGVKASPAKGSKRVTRGSVQSKK